MSDNSLFKTAVMTLLVMVFGAMIAIIVLLIGDRNPAHAQDMSEKQCVEQSRPSPNAVVNTNPDSWEYIPTQGLSGKYIVVPMQTSSNEEGLAIIDSKAGKVIFYRSWGGKNFYPVAGRKIGQDFDLLDILSKKSFSDVRANDAKFSPDKIEEAIRNRNK